MHSAIISCTIPSARFGSSFTDSGRRKRECGRRNHHKCFTISKSRYWKVQGSLESNNEPLPWSVVGRRTTTEDDLFTKDMQFQLQARAAASALNVDREMLTAAMSRLYSVLPEVFDQVGKV